MLSQEIVRQETIFAIVIENGVVTEIGNSFMKQPEIRFAGPGIRWVEEKTKKRGESCGRI